MPGMSALWYFHILFWYKYLRHLLSFVIFVIVKNKRSYWAAPNERSRLVGMSHAGGYIGNIVTLIAGGYLCVWGFDGGWPSIFYLIGIFGMVWVGVMLVTFSSSPSNHRFISNAERNYIIEQTKNASHTEKLVFLIAKTTLKL